jgi:hypothetical protein
MRGDRLNNGFSHISTSLPAEAAALCDLRYAGHARSILDRHSEQAMLRFTIAMLVAMAASGTAVRADAPLADHGRHRAAKLPAGLPRPHYDFRTTISYSAPTISRRFYPHRRYLYETPDVLFTPVYAEVPHIPRWIGTPLLPGSSSLPGYYGSPHADQYQGPYYGGPHVGYWDRLPYTCGVYGYC